VHYETVSKRHIIWSLFEENSGQYENYADFKRDWDSNTGLWAEIKKHAKKDLKGEIEDLLGIRSNNPILPLQSHSRGNGVTREIEDMVRNRRPFVNTRTNVFTSNEAREEIREEVTTNRTRNKAPETTEPKHGKHSHRHGNSHRHKHSHGHSRKHKH
jgi:hypothetical protein